MSTAPRQRAEWTTRPERSSVFILRTMTWISLHFGRNFSRIILHAISFYFLLFAPSAGKASVAYLQRALGRAPSWHERYRHVFTFAATIHDRVYLLNERFDLFSIEVRGEAELRALIAQHQGLILLGAHFGSFEIVRALGEHQAGLHVAVAMFEDNARKINAAMAAINPALQHDVIALNQIDTMLQIQQRLESGALIGMLADRSPRLEAMHSCDFLDAPAQFPQGPMRLAAVLQKPVLFMSGEYLGGNRYVLHFEPLADFSNVERSQRQAAITAAIQAYVNCLEKHCRQQPFNWFNFFDFWPAAPAVKSSADA